MEGIDFMADVKKFYITTPIYYVTDKPLLGNSYPTVIADVIARWHRLRGDDVFFLVGTDEHGEKVETAARTAGKNPKEFVDDIVGVYKDAWQQLCISYDYFIRTSDPNHEAMVSQFIEKIAKGGDIYKGFYEDWYCVPDETFWTELQLKDGKCPECGRPVKKVKEECYYFKLSKYQQALLELYEKNPAFLSPKHRSKEIINRVKAGLNDISITRSTVKWGVPFPLDKSHTIYVWVDALFNYITALGGPSDGRFARFWPADVHLVGKEINWFHSVIWPALLMSAGIELPRMVFAHGWWTAEGKKMSKSMGNSVNPMDIANKYSVDALRYVLVREMPLGDDGDYSEKSLITRLNNELVAELGNLINRTLTIAEKFDGKIEGKPELDAALDIGAIDAHMQKNDTFNALNDVFTFIRAANKYVNDKQPWKLNGSELAGVLYNLLEAARIISILIYPFMPQTGECIAVQLGTKVGKLEDCKFGNFDGKVAKGGYLFKKVL